MKKHTKNILKITSLSVVALVVLVLGGIALAVNFIFTPEKLTPVVLKVSNQALNAKLDMKSVELTFFSTFPRFGLKLTDGSLVSKAVNDTLWQKTDSLVSFDKCVVVVNPLDYLYKNKITVNYLGLENASVYAFKSKEGIANWDILKTDTTAVEVKDTAAAKPLSGGIDIRRVALKHTNIVFDDRDTRVYASLQNASLGLRASLHKERSRLSLKFKNDNIIFWQDGQLLLHRIATELETDLELERKTRRLTLNDTGMKVNGIRFDVKGSLQGDSARHALAVDLKYGLHAPTLETVLNMIPERVLKRESMTAKGEVMMQGEIKGWYGKKQMPTVTLNVRIKDASAKYDKLPYGIDNLSADFQAFVDLARQKPSHADLKIFRFRGAHTEILADAKVEDLLGDPVITFNTKSKIDLTSLAQTFPLQKNVTIKGTIDADLRLKTRLSSIKKRDIGRIRAAGKITMNGMSLQDTDKEFELTSDASLAFLGNDFLAARAQVNRLVLRSRLLHANISSLSVMAKTTDPQDTTQIAKMDCKVELNQLKGNMGDSLAVFCKKTTATVSLKPGKRNPALPQIGLSMEADTLFARAGDIRFGMDKAGFGVSAEKVRDSVWIPKGIIGFNRLKVNVPQFALPIHMRKTALTVGDHRITLKNASFRIGRSDLKASGVVYDLYGVMKHHKVLRATLDVSSHNLDCNQLINALNFPADTLNTEAEEVAETDTASAIKLFIIPKHIDFELQTDLKRVRYDKMLFENVRGEVDIRDQAVHLNSLRMRGLDAGMSATMVYRATEKKRGYAGFDFKLRRVNIGKLVDFIPSLDTIVPMLRSFQGRVNFDAAAEARLDSNMNIRIPSLRAAVRIDGDSLVLMDGETFAEISKMLHFKNKKRNVFDSISVNVTVKDGNVTVYPFVVQIDRYKAAVGGTQGLDMNFNYHVSILKSPLPFKMGVTITGNLDKMKFKLGKAKYKDAVTPVAIRKVDSTRIHLGRDIVNDFQRVIRRRE